MTTLKSKVKQFSKDTFFYGLGGAITSLISFFKAPILTRIFVPGDYGYLDFISTTFAFFLVIAGLNMISGLFRYYYEMKDDSERKDLLMTGLVFTLVTALVMLLSLQLLKPTIINYITKNSGAGRNNDLFVQLVILRTPFYLIQSFFLSILRLQRRAKLFFFISLGEGILNFILTITLVVFLKQHLFGVFFSNLFTVVLGALVVVFLLRNEIKGKFSICLFKKMMRVALPSFPSVFINLAFAKMSNLFIYQFSNELSLGLYSIAQKVGTLINLVGYAYRSAFLPFSMEIMHQENHKKDYNVFFRYAVLFFGIAAFTVSLFTKPIFFIIAPPSYYEAIKYVPFILFALAFDFSHFSLVTGIQISKRTEFATYAQALSLVISTILSYFIIRQFSAYGAAMISLPIYVVKYTFIYIFSQKLYKIDFDFGIERVFFILFALAILHSYIVANMSFVTNLFVSIFTLFITLSFIYKISLTKNERSVIALLARKYFNMLLSRQT